MEFDGEDLVKGAITRRARRERSVGKDVLTHFFLILGNNYLQYL